VGEAIESGFFESQLEKTAHEKINIGGKEISLKGVTYVKPYLYRLIEDRLKHHNFLVMGNNVYFKHEGEIYTWHGNKLMIKK